MKRLFRKDRALYLITDTVIAGMSHIEIAKKALSAGVRTLQLREKFLPKREVFHIASAIKKLTSKYKVTFIINDHLDIAFAVDADGVHLGQDDMDVGEARRILGNRKIIGISTHSIKQAVRAQQEGADYIGFGPLFHTATKDAGRPKGLRRLREVRQNVSIPIAAIGGIDSETASDVLCSGADATAVGSAILSGDMKENIRVFLSSIRRES